MVLPISVFVTVDFVCYGYVRLVDDFELGDTVIGKDHPAFGEVTSLCDVYSCMAISDIIPNAHLHTLTAWMPTHKR
jgi:hypothetical protein